jgi:hypothetical protein
MTDSGSTKTAAVPFRNQTIPNSEPEEEFTAEINGWLECP